MTEPYYCFMCERNHRSGKLYEEHLKYKELYEKAKAAEKAEKIKNKILGTKIREYTKIEWESLRDVAKRQILRLKRKMKITPSFRNVYVTNINKIFEAEL